MIEEILNKIYTSDLLSSEELHELTEWVCNKDKEIEDIRSKWYDDSEKYLLEIKRLNNIRKNTIDFCNRYLSLNLDDFNADKLLKKIIEIQGVDKE